MEIFWGGGVGGGSDIKTFTHGYMGGEMHVPVIGARST